MQSTIPRAPFCSIVVPVLNEAKWIDGFLRHLRFIAPEAETVVVDGGSRDGTKAIAEELADVVLSASKGRAAQMNAGAQVARGAVLWFLHVDLQAPPRALELIRDALSDPRVVGGCFRLRFSSHTWIYRISDSLGNFGVEVFGFALGDHGIFCRRTSYEQAGGYPLVPILEDAEIYRRLHRIGRMTQLPAEIVSSPRAYEACGPYRTTAVYFLILVLYVLRAPIPWLNQIYRRLRHDLR